MAYINDRPLDVKEDMSSGIYHKFYVVPVLFPLLMEKGNPIL